MYNIFIKKEVNNMEINYSSIGKKIRTARIALGWTQAKLAEESGVEPSNISHIERAATKLSLPTLINIANALGVSLDELVYGSLVRNEHISVNEINALLSDCSAKELSSLLEILKTAKTVIRHLN